MQKKLLKAQQQLRIDEIFSDPLSAITDTYMDNSIPGYVRELSNDLALRHNKILAETVVAHHDNVNYTVLHERKISNRYYKQVSTVFKKRYTKDYEKFIEAVRRRRKSSVIIAGRSANDIIGTMTLKDYNTGTQYTYSTTLPEGDEMCTTADTGVTTKSFINLLLLMNHNLISLIKGEHTNEVILDIVKFLMQGKVGLPTILHHTKKYMNFYNNREEYDEVSKTLTSIVREVVHMDTTDNTETVISDEVVERTVKKGIEISANNDMVVITNQLAGLLEKASELTIYNLYRYSWLFILYLSIAVSQHKIVVTPVLQKFIDYIVPLYSFLEATQAPVKNVMSKQDLTYKSHAKPYGETMAFIYKNTMEIFPFLESTLHIGKQILAANSNTIVSTLSTKLMDGDKFVYPGDTDLHHTIISTISKTVNSKNTLYKFYKELSVPDASFQYYLHEKLTNCGINSLLIASVTFQHFLLDGSDQFFHNVKKETLDLPLFYSINKVLTYRGYYGEPVSAWRLIRQGLFNSYSIVHRSSSNNVSTLPIANFLRGDILQIVNTLSNANPQVEKTIKDTAFFNKFKFSTEEEFKKQYIAGINSLEENTDLTPYFYGFHRRSYAETNEFKKELLKELTPDINSFIESLSILHGSESFPNLYTQSLVDALKIDSQEINVSKEIEFDAQLRRSTPISHLLNILSLRGIPFPETYHNYFNTDTESARLFQIDKLFLTNMYSWSILFGKNSITQNTPEHMINHVKTSAASFLSVLHYLNKNVSDYDIYSRHDIVFVKSTIEAKPAMKNLGNKFKDIIHPSEIAMRFYSWMGEFTFLILGAAYPYSTGDIADTRKGNPLPSLEGTNAALFRQNRAMNITIRGTVRTLSSHLRNFIISYANINEEEASSFEIAKGFNQLLKQLSFKELESMIGYFSAVYLIFGKNLIEYQPRLSYSYTHPIYKPGITVIFSNINAMLGLPEVYTIPKTQSQLQTMIEAMLLGFQEEFPAFSLAVKVTS